MNTEAKHELREQEMKPMATETEQEVKPQPLEYRETRYSAMLSIGDLDLKANWHGLAHADHIRETLERIADRYNNHDALVEAASFALSVLRANPVEMSERMAIEKLEAALAAAQETK